MADETSKRKTRSPDRGSSTDHRPTPNAASGESGSLDVSATRDQGEIEINLLQTLEATHGRLDHAIAVVETVWHALESAQESDDPCTHLTPAAVTLRLAIEQLVCVYSEFDSAIARMNKEIHGRKKT